MIGHGLAQTRECHINTQVPRETSNPDSTSTSSVRLGEGNGGSRGTAAEKDALIPRPALSHVPHRHQEDDIERPRQANPARGARSRTLSPNLRPARNNEREYRTEVIELRPKPTPPPVTSQKRVILAFAGDGWWQDNRAKDPDAFAYTARPFHRICCKGLSDPEGESWKVRAHTGRFPKISWYTAMNREFRHIMQEAVNEIFYQFNQSNEAYICFTCSRGKHRSVSAMHCMTLIFDFYGIKYEERRRRNLHSPCHHFCGQCNGDWDDEQIRRVRNAALDTCGNHIDWQALANA